MRICTVVATRTSKIVGRGTYSMVSSKSDVEGTTEVITSPLFCVCNEPWMGAICKLSTGISWLDCSIEHRISLVINPPILNSFCSAVAYRHLKFYGRPSRLEPIWDTDLLLSFSIELSIYYGIHPLHKC